MLYIALYTFMYDYFVFESKIYHKNIQSIIVKPLWLGYLPKPTIRSGLNCTSEKWKTILGSSPVQEKFQHFKHLHIFTKN